MFPLTVTDCYKELTDVRVLCGLVICVIVRNEIYIMLYSSYDWAFT